MFYILLVNNVLNNNEHHYNSYSLPIGVDMVLVLLPVDGAGDTSSFSPCLVLLLFRSNDFDDLINGDYNKR